MHSGGKTEILAKEEVIVDFFVLLSTTLYGAMTPTISIVQLSTRKAFSIFSRNRLHQVTQKIFSFGGAMVSTLPLILSLFFLVKRIVDSFALYNGV